MALVLAATALCGCTDEAQSSTSVSDKSSDVSAAAATPPTSAEDKDVTENTNDTDNTENSVEPEDTENAESSSANSKIAFKEDAETVKQISLQLLTALKEQDIDKYVELSNAEFYKEWWLSALTGDEDVAEISAMSIDELETGLNRFYYDSISDFDWSDIDISDLEVISTEYLSGAEDNPYKECDTRINWDDGHYSLYFTIFYKNEDFSVSCTISSIHEEDVD